MTHFILAVALVGLLAAPLPGLAATSTSQGFLDRLPQLIGQDNIDRALNGQTDQEKAAGVQQVDENIEKANVWFKETTGLGLDELARAAWKLLVWLFHFSLKVAWALVAWITEAVK